MSATVANPQPFSPALGQPLPPAPPPQPLLDGGPLLTMHRAIAARLLLAFPSAQFAHKTMRARLTPEEWARVTERTPAVALGWVSMKPVAGGRTRVWSGLGHWTVFLMARNPRTDAGPVLGDASAVGLMGMLAVATAALHGRDIAGLGSAQVGEAGEAYSENWARADMALGVLNVTVPFDLIDAAGLAALDEFLRLGARWPGVPDQVVDMRDDGDAQEGALAA